VCLPFIGYLDVERERTFRPDVVAIVDLRHDLVAEVQPRALDSGWSGITVRRIKVGARVGSPCNASLVSGCESGQFSSGINF
jgi:hypothetical protein